MFLPNKDIILVSEDIDYVIAEEVMHSLHFLNSNLNNQGKEDVDYLFKNILLECFGFFGSKIIDPARRNLWQNTKDLLPFDTKKDDDFLKTLVEQIKSNDYEKDAYLIYQQGYGLGSRMYRQYVRGKIKKLEIKNLICENLNNAQVAIFNYLYLKGKFWGIKN